MEAGTASADVIAARDGSRARPAVRERVGLRRAGLAVAALALAVLTGWLSVETVAAGSPSWLDWTICALFVAVMAWEGLVLCQVSVGFATWLMGARGLSPLERDALLVEPVATGRSRTAIVIPIYDEDVEAVFASIAVMRRSLARLGTVEDVDIHVLSDSRDPETIAAEGRHAEAAHDAGGSAIHYRHRQDNPGRKAGNIAEFLRRTRGRYDFMVVLDADSLMSGTAIRKLIRLMEDHPGVGLIQTISYAAGRRTLFARIQQFAVRLHAPLSLRSMAWWQGGDGLYYGHNAIVRCEPFLQHAELPVLPGEPPFGGEILCHDVVEAALLCRAGWEVRSLPELDGTWEEMPTNVIDLLGRERRWCQGNLQHARVCAMPGLKAGSRAHILLGIGGYLTAPLWWAFLLLGGVRALLGPDETGGFGVLAYGASTPGSYATALLVLGVVYLLLPRSLNVIRALGARREREVAGGGWRLLASAAGEQLFSLLLTPMLSLINAGFVLQICGGRVVEWVSQSRADRIVGWREAARVLRVDLLAGLFLFAAACVAGGWYALWMAPTIAGLLLGPVIVAWSSRLDAGEAARRLGLFLTVDETDPAPELLDLQGRS